MKIIIYFILIFFPFSAIAQTGDSVKILTLHPSVGKSIDVKEKKEFYLFPDYKDSVFRSAEILKYNDTAYTIRFTTTTGNVFEKPTTTKELDAMFAKIDTVKPTEYVENKHDKKPQKPDREFESDDISRSRAQVSLNVGNVVLQMILITLSILAQLSY